MVWYGSVGISGGGVVGSAAAGGGSAAGSRGRWRRRFGGRRRPRLAGPAAAVAGGCGRGSRFGSPAPGTARAAPPAGAPRWSAAAAPVVAVAVVVVVTRVDGVGSSRRRVLVEQDDDRGDSAASTAATPAARNANGWRYQRRRSCLVGFVGSLWLDEGQVRTGAVVEVVRIGAHVGDVLGLRPRQRPAGAADVGGAGFYAAGSGRAAAAPRPTWHLPRRCPGRPSARRRSRPPARAVHR